MVGYIYHGACPRLYRDKQTLPSRHKSQYPFDRLVATNGINPANQGSSERSDAFKRVHMRFWAMRVGEEGGFEPGLGR